MANIALNLGSPSPSSINHTVNSTLSSAVTLSNPGASVRGIMMQADGTINLRYTLDGTTPTASIGYILFAGDPPSYLDLFANMTLKIIEEDTGGILQYCFVVG